MIFNRVIRPSLERFCNLRPSVPVLGVRDDELSILLDAPLFAFNLRIEMIVPSLATLLSDSPREFIRDSRPSFRTERGDELDDSRVLLGRPRSLDELRIEHLLPSVQTLHVGATVAKVHGYAKMQNQNRASVIVSPHHRASIETLYARTPSRSLILSLSLPRVHLARFQTITKKKRTNLLPILPSVHLHRLTQQLILRAANERSSVTPKHSRTNHASRNQSITRALDRSTPASPLPVLPFPLASFASSRGV